MTCPCCRSTKINKNGFFRRKLSRSYSQRFVCKDCGKKFSASTFSITYFQKKPMINKLLFSLFCSSTSFRRCATILNVHYETIYYRFLWMTKLAERKQQEFLNNYTQPTELYLDEMESIEHTKLKPLTLPLIVDQDQKILGVSAGEIPAKGHLAEVSRRKYGLRENHSSDLIADLLSKLSKNYKPLCVKSDAKPSYQNLIKNMWPKVRHLVYSRKSEKKKEQLYLNSEKKVFDPMFAINQRCAKLRDDIKRLARKNWCTTKKPENLRGHLLLYACYNNKVSIF